MCERDLNLFGGLRAVKVRRARHIGVDWDCGAEGRSKRGRARSTHDEERNYPE